MSEYTRFANELRKFLRPKTSTNNHFIKETARQYCEIVALNDAERNGRLKDRLIEVTGLSDIGNLSDILKKQKTGELGKPNVAYGLYFLAKVDDDYGMIVPAIERVLFKGTKFKPVTFEDEFGFKLTKLNSQSPVTTAVPQASSSSYRPLDESQTTVAKPPQVNETEKKPLPKQTTNEDDRWRNYPYNAVTRFYDRFHKTDVVEAQFKRQQWTNGNPDADPEGIVRSLVEHGPYGLQMPDADCFAARVFFAESKIRTRLGSLQTGFGGRSSTELFKNPEPEYQEINHELGKFAEPNQSFLKFAIQTTSLVELDALKKQADDELTYAIYKCVANRREGVNQDLNSFFFEQLSKIERFSDFTRGIAALLKARNDEQRGAISERIDALKHAEQHLDLAVIARSDLAFSADLHLQILIQNISTRIYTTTLENIGDGRAGKNDADNLAIASTLGLNELHFEKPDSIIDVLNRAEKSDAATAAMTFMINNNNNILKCIAGNYDATEFFDRAFIINKAVADHNPHLACVTLTPLIGYAELAGLSGIADELFRWRHGGHPIAAVNVHRTKSIDTPSFGFEPALDLLATYFMMKNRVLSGDRGSEPRLEATVKKLLSNERKFYSLQLKTISRYYARFKASHLNDKRLYLESESHDAPSHHLYMGVVRDQFTNA